jgi:hypothetical protein
MGLVIRQDQTKVNENIRRKVGRLEDKENDLHELEMTWRKI